jgi:predicted HTH transcriptional regulator
MYDLNYLNQLIANKVEENSELEYKAATALQREDKKITEATKDVSAFANSNGGVLIYGISENQANKHLPGNIDLVDRKAITKEWLGANFKCEDKTPYTWLKNSCGNHFGRSSSLCFRNTKRGNGAPSG